MVESQLSHLQLLDGRWLDVYCSGPAGAPVFLFHHGTPGSYKPGRTMEEAVHRRGMRFVTTSRAGYGDSSRNPGRSVADVVADTAAVLDAVGAETCVVAGWSGGGPHTLACAALLPERVKAALVIAGVAPYGAEGLDFLVGMGQENVVEFGLAMEGEGALRPSVEEWGAHLRLVTPDEIAAALGDLLPAVDKAVLTGEFAAEMAESFHEGMRVGVDGWLDDDLAFTRPWGFSLEEIAVPVTLWQGSEDRMVPFAHGQWLAAHIPGVSAHLEPGEGHLSIGIGAMDRMLDELVALATA